MNSHFVNGRTSLRNETSFYMKKKYSMIEYEAKEE